MSDEEQEIKAAMRRTIESMKGELQQGYTDEGIIQARVNEILKQGHKLSAEELEAVKQGYARLIQIAAKELRESG